jgi:pentatricopeptide repeat protein
MSHIQGIFDFCYQNEIKLTAKSYSKLISHYGRLKNVKMIDKTLLHCASRGVIPDTVLLNVAMDAYIRCKLFSQAAALFDIGVRSAGSNLDVNALLAKRMGSVELSQVENDIMDYFFAFKVKANTRSFNTMLKGIRDHPKEDSFALCMKLYLELQNTATLKPDSVTLNTVIDAAVTDGHFEAAEILLFRTRGNAPGVEAYTSLLAGYANQGLVDNAFRVFNLMESRGVSATEKTLTALMNSCLKARKVARAKKLLRILDAEEDEWAQREAAEKEAERAMERSEFEGALSADEDDEDLNTLALGEPNKVYTSASLDALQAQSGQDFTKIKSSRELTLVELTKLHGSYVIGLCGLANSALTAFEQDKMLKVAQKHLLRMEDRGIPIDINTANAFIQALCSTSPPRIGDASAIFDALQLLGIQPDKYTYSIIFSALGKAGYVDEAVQIYKSIDSLDLDIAAVNAILRALVEGADPLDAVKLYYDLRIETQAGPSVQGATSSMASLKDRSVGTAQTGSQFTYPRATADKVTYSVLFLACLRSLRMPAPRPMKGPEVHREQPMAYDAESGRFYEVYENALYGDGDGSGAAGAASSAYGKKLSMEVFPLPFARRVLNADKQTDSMKRRSGSPGAEPVRTGHKVIDNRRSGLKRMNVKNLGLDKLVQGIYREMRFIAKVKPDDLMVHTLNHLFDKVYARHNGISDDTAALIFEDLVICGFSPAQLEPILACCEYSDKYKAELMYDEEEVAVKRLRRTATSNQLFKKYRWNNINSGWAPFL